MNEQGDQDERQTGAADAGKRDADRDAAAIKLHGSILDRHLGQRSELGAHYAAAITRLRAVGYDHVADRFDLPESGGLNFDRTPMSVAIMAAIDVVDCRRAATLDPVHADRWKAVAEDQAQISRAALALKRVEVER